MKLENFKAAGLVLGLELGSLLGGCTTREDVVGECVDVGMVVKARQGDLCENAVSEEANAHCLALVRDSQAAIVSACMTGKENKVVHCKVYGPHVNCKSFD